MRREGDSAPEEVMSLIATEGEPVTIAKIAAELVCSVSTARRHVQRLATRGWVSTAPDQRRRMLLSLTSAGRTADDQGERL